MQVSSDGSILDGKTKRNGYQLIEDLLIFKRIEGRMRSFYILLFLEPELTGAIFRDDSERRNGQSTRSNIIDSSRNKITG
jgi:hypothetical protein